MKFGLEKFSYLKDVAKAKKPEALLFAGILGFGAALYFACKSTTQLDKTLDDIQQDIDVVKRKAEAYQMDQKQVKRDLTFTYINGAMRILKLYSTPTALFIFSTACVTKSYKIVRTDNILLATEIKGLEHIFDKYRNNVIEELGLDADRRFYHGIKTQDIEIEDEEGKKKKVKNQEVFVDDPNGYAFYFDETCQPLYTGNMDLDESNLKRIQSYLTDLLYARGPKGHVFLNEVHDMVCHKRNTIGQFAGWLGGDRGKDGYIDLRIQRVMAWDEDAKKYVEKLLIDPNVDGNIVDYI